MRNETVTMLAWAITPADLVAKGNCVRVRAMVAQLVVVLSLSQLNNLRVNPDKCFYVRFASISLYSIPQKRAAKFIERPKTLMLKFLS